MVFEGHSQVYGVGIWFFKCLKKPCFSFNRLPSLVAWIFFSVELEDRLSNMVYT